MKDVVLVWWTPQAVQLHEKFRYLVFTIRSFRKEIILQGGQLKRRFPYVSQFILEKKMDEKKRMSMHLDIVIVCMNRCSDVLLTRLDIPNTLPFQSSGVQMMPPGTRFADPLQAPVVKKRWRVDWYALLRGVHNGISPRQLLEGQVLQKSWVWRLVVWGSFRKGSLDSPASLSPGLRCFLPGFLWIFHSGGWGCPPPIFWFTGVLGFYPWEVVLFSATPVTTSPEDVFWDIYFRILLVQTRSGWWYLDWPQWALHRILI